MWELVSYSSNEVEEKGFWEAVRVWIERPHVINRRLMGVDIRDNWMLQSRNEENNINSDSLWKLLKDYINICSDVSDILKNHYELNACNQIDIWEENGNNSGVFIQTRKLLPKQPQKFKIQNEIVIIDRKRKILTFLSSLCNENNCNLTPNFDYRLILMDCKRIKLEIVNCEQKENFQNHSVKWLESHVLHKITKWAKQSNKLKSIPSLSVVPINKYYNIYNRLKLNYWEKLIQIWSECTDPVKYIYEDIAIAAYLLTIFEMEKEARSLDQKQSFVDLGCGNGLLVYILTSEGHSGIGIDIRKRTIWDHYKPKVQLMEMSVTPSDKMLFPEYDWLIGNHSDELTPWIPVIAARSSYNMRMFLLPCCPFSFEGKYQRIHSDCSQYQSYLYFIREVCEKMGFEVQEDKLRIPSTKRLCFICLSRIYSSCKEVEINLQRTEYINKFLKQSAYTNIEKSNVSQENEELSNKCNKNKFSSELQQGWIQGFQPRNKIQEVCNCSALDRDYLNELVKCLAMILLNLRDNYISIFATDQEIFWNKGGELSIGELANKLESEMLKQLKHQYGGLQTLLRNHRHIFTVKNGQVSITLPTKEESAKQYEKLMKRRKKMPSLKTKSCWFNIHHPQGCPLTQEDCTYIHENKLNN